MLELLENERGSLPAELHHAMNPNVHDQLKQRKQAVEALIERLRSPVTCGT
jgi:hypothetical protein